MSDAPASKNETFKLNVARSDRKTRDAILKVVTEGVAKKANGESREIANPWENSGVRGVYAIIEPPFDPLGLALLSEQNSELNQCIEAMEINIAGYGWRLKLPKEIERIVDADADPEFAARISSEKERFEEFLTYADYDEKSFVSLRRRTRKDLEGTGYACWEVVRDDSGEICSFNHIPSYMIRLRRLEPTSVIVDQVRVIGRGKDRRQKRVQIRKRFRSFVQAKYSAGSDEPSVVFFREYGDPRPRFWRTGELVPADTEVNSEELATELLYFRIYSPRTPYGVPRYIGNLLAIFGSRAAEEINYVTFRNNNIPSMAILVSNGFLTDATVDRIQLFTETAIQGSDNYSKFLVIEAEGLVEGGGSDPSMVKIAIEKLADTQTQDELFQKYDANNQDKVRRSFRLPPIFVGRSDDYTRATAETSRRIGDEQVFDPEREADDHEIGRVLADMGMIYHEFETGTPNVTNDQDLIAVLTGAERAGGATPRIARTILEDILGKDLGGFSAELDPDIPFTLQMAEKVKNQANAGEPGQQLTAMKRLQEALGLDEEAFGVELGLSILEQTAKVEKREVVFSVGAQADAIVRGHTPAFLHPIAYSLEGREYLIGDGFDVVGRVEFASTTKMAIPDAAAAIGMPESDVRGMFPGRSEIWVSTVGKVEKLDPIPYTQPDDSHFSHVER